MPIPATNILSSDGNARSCYLCNLQLAAGVASQEHIIPNAIGGRLKSRMLLCKLCNSKLGAIDASICRLLLPLANILAVQRERGDSPPSWVTMNGRQYLREANGDMRPIDEQPKLTMQNDGSVHFSIQSSTRAQARKHLQGLKRRYPKLDVETAISTAVATVDLVDTEMQFQFGPLGGADAFRAVVKIAVGYFLHVGGTPSSIPEAIEVIAGQDIPTIARVGLLYAIDPLPKRDDQQVLHVVAVVPNQRGGMHAYVELLGALRFAVLLTDNYVGPPINQAYAYDVCSQKQVDVDSSQLRGIPWTHEDWDGEHLRKAIEPVLALALARQKR
jgi:hypothetical protein